MSLISGPGKGGSTSSLPSEVQLCVEKHLQYIQSLDKASTILPRFAHRQDALTESYSVKTSWIIG